MSWLLGLLALVFPSVSEPPPVIQYSTPIVIERPVVEEVMPAVEEEKAEVVVETKEKEWGCVEYLREKFGVPIRGDALFVPVNLTLVEAREGDVIVFQYGQGWQRAHVALIQKIDLKNARALAAEYLAPHGERVRWVAFNDPHIIGFHRPNSFLASKMLQ